MSESKELAEFKGVLAILIVGIFAAIGSNFFSFIQGKNEYLAKYKRNITPCFKNFEIPDLIGAILFGLLARNVFTDFMDTYYNDSWAENTRMICLVVILLRGGLELKFKGKATIVILMSTLPMTFEAITVAIVSKPLLDIDWAIAFSLGFLLGAVSPAVLVPNMIYFIEKKKGTAKGMPNTMIAASSFDDILAIIMFGIFSTIAINDYSESKKDPGMIIVKVIYELVSGIACGIFLGMLSKFVKNKKSDNFKFIWLLTLSIGMTLMFYFIEFKEAKYIAIITFGYVVKRVWEDKKPDKELKSLWGIMKYFLFGTIGAAIDIRNIQSDSIGYGIVIILCGSLVRIIIAFFIPSRKFYTFEECIFVAVSWLPKATVQAALGGTIKEEGLRLKSKALLSDGEKLLTISVLAILITAPLGSILTYLAGEKYLSDDSETKNESNTEKEIDLQTDKGELEESGILIKEEEEEYQNN